MSKAKRDLVLEPHRFDHLPMIERQVEIFGRPPRQSSADGGFASRKNVEKAKNQGVKDVCFKQKVRTIKGRNDNECLGVRKT